MRDMELVGTGREADVYALDGTRVLRRYRNGGDVTAEAEVMQYVRAHGFPVPKVFEASGPDLVMERLDGPLLGEVAYSTQMDPDAAGLILASLQHRLHTLPPRAGPTGDDRILHLDLHPHNVFVTPTGPVLVDWRNAAEGPPSLDVAVSALIIASAALGSFVPTELSPGARQMLIAFLRASRSNPLEQLGRASERLHATSNLDAEEIGRVDDAAALVAEEWRKVAGRPE